VIDKDNPPLDDARIANSWQLVNEYLKPIAHLLEEPGVTEIMVNRWDSVFIEKHGMLEKTDITFNDEDHVATAITMMGTASGQSVDSLNHPVVNARLPDGSRVCGTLAPTAANGSDIAIRVFPKQVFTDKELVARGSLNEAMRDYLRMAVLARCNLLVSGSTGSGKTTLLNVLGSFIPDTDGVVTVEDTQELKLGVASWRPYVASNRRQDDQSARQVTMPYLIEMALRKNPDRIVVGEMRDSQAVDAFLQAINTGHNGCLSTLHANNPVDAIERLKGLIATEGRPAAYVDSLVRSNLQIIVQVEKVPLVGRLISSITEVNRESITELWHYDFANKRHVANDQALPDSLVHHLSIKLGLI